MQSLRDVPDIHAKAIMLAAMCSVISVIVCMATSEDYSSGHAGNEKSVVAVHWIIVFSLIWTAVLCHKQMVGEMSFYAVSVITYVLYGVLLGEASHEHAADIVFNVFSFIFYSWATNASMFDYVQSCRIHDVSVDESLTTGQ